MNEVIEKIAKYIVEGVQERSIVSGFQYIISHTEIIERFHLELGQAIDDAIEEALWKMDEVNDVVVDVDGFDVVLGTAYAPNYNEEDYHEN